MGSDSGELTAAALPGDDVVYLAAFQQLVLERTHDLVTILDPTGRIVYASPSWEAMLGYAPDEVVGTALLDYCHPDDLEPATKAIAAQVAGAHIPPIVTRRRARDGRWLFIESNATPILDADGNVVYILGSARNVTESEELRERVREMDALYRLADAVARASSLDDLLTVALDALVDATGAPRAAVLLYDDAGVMRFRAWRGLSETYRAATEGHSPWTPDAVDPRPVLVADVAAARFDAELERTVVGEGIRALAFVPLVHGGRLLGTFMLYRDAPHEWTPREVMLATTIANHLGSAAIRAQSQHALRVSSEQLQAIMRSVDEGIVLQERSGRIVYANDAAARFVGYESAADFLTADRASSLARFEIYAEDGSPVDPHDLPGRKALDGVAGEVTVRYRFLPGGDERWSLVRATPVLGPAGEVEMSVSVIRDVTDERRARAERERTQERIRFLSRASELLNETLDLEQTIGALADLAVPTFAGHVTVDLFEDGRLRCVGARHLDPAKTELMRRLREEYPPTVDDHPVQRALRESATQFVPDVQAEADSMAHDERHAQAIHELANTSGIVVPLIARGRTFGAITFGTVPPQPRFGDADVETAEELARRASTALDNSLLYREAQGRAHAAQALEFVDDGVFLLDREGTVRLWNPAAEKTFRIRSRHAVGRRIVELVPDWDTLRERIRVSPAHSSRAARAAMLPVDVEGQERWISISGVRFPGGTVYAFRDMTEERAVEQLKSDFVSTVSHELRTPLAAIYGAALTLQRDDVRLEESQRTGLLDVISAEADRLARIVNDILWASRLDSGRMGVAIESCDAARLVDQVVKATRSHAPDGVVLEVEAAEGLPPVAADPDKLRQVLTNLVDNAVKYSPDGGRVVIGVSQAGSHVRMCVEDEGLGIPPAEQDRIFEKFFRLDPQLTRGVGGTGLGLYIVRELVYRMDGRIWIVSDGRRGSTFFVELPVAAV